MRSNMIGAVLAAVPAVQGPLAAAPAWAQAGQTLNVQGADIRAFIQDVARSTGRTFIVDPAVTGTVTVTSDRPLSRAQLFEVFLSTLRANGLVVGLSTDRKVKVYNGSSDANHVIIDALGYYK